MKKHIEKIKKRPIAERKKMATIFAVIVTVIIIILWITILSVFKSEKGEVKNNFNFDSFQATFEKIGDDIDQIGESFQSSKQDLNLIQTELEMLEEQELENIETENTPDEMVENEFLVEFETEINNTELEQEIN